MTVRSIFLPFLAASALFACPVAAEPITTYTVDFTYDLDAPASETYAQFKRSARAACRMDAPDVLTFAARREERACAQRLLSDAVQATNLSALIALHEAETEGASQPKRCARRSR